MVKQDLIRFVYWLIPDFQAQIQVQAEIQLHVKLELSNYMQKYGMKICKQCADMQDKW